MKKEYDFSKGERGKFFEKDAQFNLPVYLEKDTYNFVVSVAKKHKTDISVVVNELLKRDMKIIDYVKK
jgi:hypothetical protein